MWEERIGPIPIWRFRLVKAQTGEAVGFAGGKAVLRYLQTIFASDNERDQTPTKGNWVASLVERVGGRGRGLTDSELTAAAAGSAPPNNPIADAIEENEPPVA